jgi:SAM-dependent methyltransferase
MRDYGAFRRQLLETTSEFPLAKFYPILNENSAESGVASGHYFHQDLYVARRVYENMPQRHIDVASRVDGFVSHVAVFREIEVADIRGLSTTAKNIRFLQCDLMNSLSVGMLGQADSVSCLHALEHFGLGRYGDPISADGHVHGLRNLCRMVKHQGLLYLSVPIGRQRVEFNGQRVFAAKTLPSIIHSDFRLDRFSFVDDAGNIHENVAFPNRDVERNFGCNLGCGIYEFRRGG